MNQILDNMKLVIYSYRNKKEYEPGIMHLK